MAQFINLGGGNYEVITSSSPQFINEISLYLFNLWKEFAEGKTSLNDRRIEHPTGRLAASLRITGNAETTITISATAKHALFLELGHPAIDLKKKLQWGRRYPMHRGARQFTGYSAPVPLSKKGPALAWVIPPMRPYAPAEYLAKLAVKLLEQGRI